MRALLAFFLLFSSAAFAQDTLLNHVRNNTREMFSTESVCLNIYNAFEQTDYQEENLLLGYHGATLLGMARHDPNPFKKMSHFSDGKKLLEKAISRDSNNLELRFLRLTIQTYMPSFLGYDESKESDKAFLLNNLNAANNETFASSVRDFIAQAEKQGKL